MKCIGYLNINSNGTIRATKSKTSLAWNEISIRYSIDIPDLLFERPLIEAKIKIDESILPKKQPVEIILNTKELIEQSTGAKIDFRIIEEKKCENTK